MTRTTSFAACLALLLTALPLLPSAAVAEGPLLPPVGSPTLHDCYGGDAGNTLEEAQRVSTSEYPCYGWLLPATDEHDWFAVYLQQGQSFSVSLGPMLVPTDLDVCVHGPDGAELACSKNPAWSWDWVYVPIETSGTYYVHAYVATGGGYYALSLFAPPPPPPVWPDVAILDLEVQKSVLTTDAGSTGVVNPVGSWTLRATFHNAGTTWACARVSFYVNPLNVHGYLLPVYFGGSEAWGPCLAPGGTAVVSAEWRPWGQVGDIEVHAYAHEYYDSDWSNNHRSQRNFVVVGGL